MSWVGGMGYGDWRAGSAEGLNRSWVNGRAGSELGRRKGWIGDGSTEGLNRSWVGERARSELGRRAGFMVDGLTQIGNGGKERNSEGRWRRKCEKRGGWDEMKEKEEKNKEKKSLK